MGMNFSGNSGDHAKDHGMADMREAICVQMMINSSFTKRFGTAASISKLLGHFSKMNDMVIDLAELQHISNDEKNINRSKHPRLAVKDMIIMGLMLAPDLVKIEELCDIIAVEFCYVIDTRTVKSNLDSILKLEKGSEPIRNTMKKNGFIPNNPLEHNIACVSIYYPYGGRVIRVVRNSKELYSFRPFMKDEKLPILCTDIALLKDCNVEIQTYVVKDAIIFILKRLSLKKTDEPCKLTAKEIATEIQKIGICLNTNISSLEKTVKRDLRTLTELRNEKKNINLFLSEYEKYINTNKKDHLSNKVKENHLNFLHGFRANKCAGFSYETILNALTYILCVNLPFGGDLRCKGTKCLQERNGGLGNKGTNKSETTRRPNRKYYFVTD
ncbi:MAG: hypothetical protein K6E85_01080 [Lachnospiraceae bacterium]|nr:hypothetical protein [Lachnospiraceae bacterium]